jgi:hypothetical protein
MGRANQTGGGRGKPAGRRPALSLRFLVLVVTPVLEGAVVSPLDRELARTLRVARDGEPSIRTGHTKNARPGEPEGLPDLTSTTLTQPARRCQAVAEAGAVDADGLDPGVDRAAAPRRT